MSANVQETFKPYFTANANIVCFTGSGACGGISVVSASNTPTLTLLDSNAAVAGNGNANCALWGTFTPVAGTWYPAPGKVLNGLTLVVGGNVVCTVYGNKG